MFISPSIHHVQQWLSGELHVSHSTLVRISLHWFCAYLTAPANEIPSGNLCNAVQCYAVLCNED